MKVDSREFFAELCRFQDILVKAPEGAKYRLMLGGAELERSLGGCNSKEQDGGLWPMVM